MKLKKQRPFCPGCEKNEHGVCDPCYLRREQISNLQRKIADAKSILKCYDKKITELRKKEMETEEKLEKMETELKLIENQ